MTHKPIGAPRSVSLAVKNMIALGEEMVTFVTKNKKTILHLCEWYTIEKGFTYNQWKTFIQRPEFIPYYEQALKIVGLKYIDKNSNVRDSISHRWQRIYFADLKEGEDSDADSNVERRLKVLKSETQFQQEESKRIIDEISKNRRVLE